jgi:hypothetical protein
LPIDITVDGHGNVLVLEPHRIVEFDYAGNFVRSTGEGLLKGAVGFCQAGDGIAVAGVAEVWFLDDRGNMVMHLEHPIVEPDLSEEISDVAFHQGKIFLLTTRRVRVFRFVEVGR